jgi:hypothetical protein
VNKVRERVYKALTVGDALESLTSDPPLEDQSVLSPVRR